MKFFLNVFNVLSSKHRKRFLMLQVLVVLMALAEVTVVLSIGAFMAALTDPGKFIEQSYISPLYGWLGYDNYEFVFLIGVAVITVLALSTILSVITIWRLSMFANEVGVDLGNRLYRYYGLKNYEFHVQINSAEITKKIAFEADRMTMSIIVPMMQLNAKLVLAIFISALIFFYNPYVAMFGAVIFLAIYSTIYLMVRRRLTQNSKILSTSNQLRYKLISELFGGIKDVLLLNKQEDFYANFESTGKSFSHSRGQNQTLVNAPRYIVELVAFGSVIFLVLFLIGSSSTGLQDILPMLSVYAMAGYKLMPAFQQVYTNFSTIKGNQSAFEVIKRELTKQKAFENSVEDQKSEVLQFKNDITLSSVSYRYPGEDKNALDNINVTLPYLGVIGFVGTSGSGKSTLMDVLTGLLVPTQGNVTMDGKAVNFGSIRSYQNKIGYVSQNIYLRDGSIRENIAFELRDDVVDANKIENSIKKSHLEEFVNSLEFGLDSTVGERGVQLSGGQKQRIGIARALYRDSEILILDEATSALDGITEKVIMDAIKDFSGNKTIIMVAHRLNTVKDCQVIYLMEEGRIIDGGNYDDLVLRNPKFRKMTEHA